MKKIVKSHLGHFLFISFFLLFISNISFSQIAGDLPDAEWEELTYSYVSPIPMEIIEQENQEDRKHWVETLTYKIAPNLAGKATEDLIVGLGSQAIAKVTGVFISFINYIESVGGGSTSSFQLLTDQNEIIENRSYLGMYFFSCFDWINFPTQVKLEKRTEVLGLTHWQTIRTYNLLTDYENSQLTSISSYYTFCLKAPFVFDEAGIYRIGETVFEVVADNIAPQILSHTIDSKKNGNIKIVFSENISIPTLSNYTINVIGSESGEKNCTYNFNTENFTLTIDPISDFKNEENVFVNISDKIEDLSGNQMNTRYSFTYKVDNPESYIVTALTDQTGSISPSGNLTFFEKSTVKFSSIPNPGYEVDRWYLNDEVVQIGGGNYTLENIQSSYSIFVSHKKIINGQLKMKSPNGGEILFKGRNSYITWEETDETGDNVKIDLLKNNSVYKIITEETLNDGSYKWEIPANESVGDDYQIKVSSVDGSISDISDSFFEITDYIKRDTIEIRTVEDLQKVSSGGMYPRNSYYILMNDITISSKDNFKPIGTDYNHYFRGTFDGNKHTIRELEINLPEDDHIGLFSVLMDKGIIKNLNIEDDGIYGYQYVGALVGENAGTIINCGVLIDDIESTGKGYLGGLVGENTQSGKIINCFAKCIDGGDIEVDAENVSPNGIGGIAGENSGIIKWCYADCDIDADSYNKNIEGDGVGGLVGINYGIISECHSSCSYIDGDDWVGGIVGRLEGGTLEDSYFNGNGVSCDNNGGGLVGYASGGNINRCYVNSSVGANSEIGLLVGENKTTISNSFWNKDIAANKNAIGRNSGVTDNIKGLNSLELKSEDSFTTNWDFQNIWVINNESLSPQLRGIGDQLEPPINVVASSNNSDEVIVSWSNVDYQIGITSYTAKYKVYRSSTPNSDSEMTELSDWINTNSFNDKTSPYNEKFYYFVKCSTSSNGARESNYSEYAIGKKSFPQIDAPLNVNASDKQINTILIKWEQAANAKYYKVYRSLYENDSFIPISDWIDNTSFNDIPPEVDTEYYYRVRAALDKNENGISEFSNPDIGSYIHPNVPLVAIIINPERPTEKQEIIISINAESNDSISKIVLYWRTQLNDSVRWNSINRNNFSVSCNIGSFSANDTVDLWAEVWDSKGLHNKTEITRLIVSREELSAPSRPFGPTTLKCDSIAGYSCIGAKSNLGNAIEYRFNWGDGQFSNWGDSVRNHSWSQNGTYIVFAQTRTISDTTLISLNSSGIMVTISNSLNTGIKSRHSNSGSINAYPNPFNDKLVLKVPSGRERLNGIYIYSIQGKFINFIEVTSKEVDTIEWNGTDKAGNNCAPGTYLIKMFYEGFTFSQKVVLVK